MKEVNIKLPKGKEFYWNLIDKYDEYTHKDNKQVSFITDEMVKEILTIIENLLNENDIELEDKLWLIKSYTNSIRLEKFYGW